MHTYIHIFTHTENAYIDMHIHIQYIAIQDAAEMLQDGTVQDGSKKPALHLKTFLNAYKALSRGGVHLCYILMLAPH